MRDPENFSGPFKTPYSVEHVCLQCNSKYYMAKILGPDNVYRMLPGSCRVCGPAARVNHGTVDPVEEDAES